MNINYKFNIGDKVHIAMAFACPANGKVPVCDEVDLITKREFRNGRPNYRLKGLTGWFPETTLVSAN